MRLLLRAMREHYYDLNRIIIPLVVLTLLVPLLVLGLPLLERQLIDDIILGDQLDRLPGVLALYVGVWLLLAVLQAVTTVMRMYLHERLSMRLRQRLIEQSEDLSVSFSANEHSGKTMALFVSDVPVLVNTLSSLPFTILGGCIMLVTSIVLMFSLSWQLAIVIAIVPPIVAGAAWVITRPMRPATRRIQEMTAELTRRIQEDLTGVREIVAFGQQQAQATKFSNTLWDLLRLRMRLTYMETAFQGGQSLFALTLNLVVLGFGAYLVVNGTTTVGSLFAIRTLFGYMFQQLGTLFTAVSTAQKTIAASDRVYDYLDLMPTVMDHPDAIEPESVQGGVEFDHVSFGYDPDTFVLHDITLRVEPGQVIALVGPSGAGKSSLVGLIPRFYDPVLGEVRIDGMDLRAYTLHGLRSHVGVVFQNSFLFAASIRENIAFGREGATEDEVIAAAKMAYAWEFIEQLPNGLDTHVGERGTQLSEGQKQRIAIARALLRDPRVLILDEPTSALDARSENLLQAALDSLMHGRTTFVIAHRLATVRRAQKILVLDGGRIVQQGTHFELMHEDGLYRELYDLQFGDQDSSIPTETAYQLPAVSAPAD